MAAYRERHRAYHTLEHIEACLGAFDEVRGRTGRPAAIEMAIWFHDAVYRPLRGGNEEASAELARKWLERGGVEPATVERVVALILATRHAEEPAEPDARWLVDIDLGILGADPEAYGRYETAIRREYRLVPGPIFRRKRAELLEAFLARPRLYLTDHFHVKLEVPARRNLAVAILKLRKP